MERINKRKKKEDIAFTEYGRVPPQAVDLECAVLGAALIEYEAQEIFIKISDSKYYYKEAHQIIAQAIIDVNKKEDKHADILLVTNHLKTIGKLEIVGGAYYITILTNNVVGTGNLEVWCRIIHQKWMQREGISVSSKLIQLAFEDTTDVFDMLDKGIEQLRNILPEEKEFTKEDSLKKSLSNIYLATDKIAGKKRSILFTGWERFDKLVHLKSSAILIGGAGGIGKTIFTVAMVKKMLDHPGNKDISIKWAVLDHEDGSSIYKKFYGIDGFISIKDLEGIDVVDKAKHNLILSLNEDYKKYDIEFIEGVITVEELKRQWIQFCKKRTDGRMNLLVLDNVMRLKTNKYFKSRDDKDEYITSVLADMYVETKKYNAICLFLHHFTKEQKSSRNLENAYRPKEEHLRGSTRYVDILDIALFINRPGKYPEIIANYPGFEDILKHLYILDIPKQSIGEEETIYFWGDPRYSIFDEINEINNQL